MRLKEVVVIAVLALSPVLSGCGAGVSVDGSGVKVNPPTASVLPSVNVSMPPGIPTSTAQGKEVLRFLSDLAKNGYAGKYDVNSPQGTLRATADVTGGVTATFERSASQSSGAFTLVKLAKSGQEIKGDYPKSPNFLELKTWLLLNGH